MGKYIVDEGQGGYRYFAEGSFSTQAIPPVATTSCDIEIRALRSMIGPEAVVLNLLGFEPEENDNQDH